jgi:hypothetical protein
MEKRSHFPAGYTRNQSKLSRCGNYGGLVSSLGSN